MRNYYEGIRWVHERFQVFHELPQPIVAAVQGYCLGFGFELALMCDIRVAADDAVFALPEAQVGVSIDAGGDLRLAHEVGAGHAKLLALTGRRIDAPTAERLGIVQQVTTRDELVPAAMAIADEIAANAPLAVQSIKRTIDAFAYRGLPEAMRFEALSASIEFVSDDMPAGLRGQGQEAAGRIRGQVAAVGLPEPPPAGSPFLPAGTFDGTTAIVTGGGTGLGKAIAVEFARAGAAIGVLSRPRSTAWPGVAAVEAVGGRAAHAPADIREPEQIAAAFDALEAALGPATVLVNNAAANFPVPAASMRPNGFRSVTKIVLDGTFFCTQELRRRVTERGVPGGAICNILATQSFTGGPGMAHTAAAKAGVGNLTKSLAVEWAPDGIRVNALAPGLFPHEDMRDDLQALRPEGESVDARRSPAGRLGRLHELGWAATWLCSPYAAFVTGHTLVVDGANWLRRDFVMPEFTPVADQLAQVLRPPD